MIVCSCKVLTAARVAATAAALARAEPGRPVTAGRIFRALGIRPQCGICLSEIRRVAAAAGATVTCPEPLAMVSVESAEDTAIEVEIMFDVEVHTR